jgi:hypothetical protein
MPDMMGIPVKVGVGLRAGLRLQDPDKPKNMNEFHLDGGYSNVAELRFSGDVTENFGLTANFNAVIDGGGLAHTGGAAVGIMDLLAKIHVADEFNIWVGRLLVPSDRSNFAGPFFMSPWNYPGFYFANGGPIGPKDWSNGRDQGATVWGNALGDKLKYYAGIYGIDEGLENSSSPFPGGQFTNPYYSGRLSYTFQGSEPGYFGSSTYYGSSQVFTLGIGGQYQKGGAVDTTTGKPTDMGMFMADALAEENIAGVGSFDFEGQFYKFTDGYDFGGVPGPTHDVYAPSAAFYLLVSYLTPEPIGIGKLQPLVRWQQTIDPAWTIFDAALAYVVRDYFARVVLTYEHIDTGGDGPIGNSFQLGFQIQK